MKETNIQAEQMDTIADQSVRGAAAEINANADDDNLEGEVKAEELKP